MEDRSADLSSAEDASDSDDDAFTMEDLFGENNSEPEDGDSDDETVLQVKPGPPRSQMDQAASGLQETAADLLNHLMDPHEVTAKQKRRRSRVPPASGSLSMLPRAQSPRVFSILMKHGHLLTQVSGGICRCRTVILASLKGNCHVLVRQLYMPLTSAVVPDGFDSSNVQHWLKHEHASVSCTLSVLGSSYPPSDSLIAIIQKLFCVILKLEPPTVFGLSWPTPHMVFQLDLCKIQDHSLQEAAHFGSSCQSPKCSHRHASHRSFLRSTLHALVSSWLLQARETWNCQQVNESPFLCCRMQQGVQRTVHSRGTSKHQSLLGSLLTWLSCKDELVC